MPGEIFDLKCAENGLVRLNLIGLTNSQTLSDQMSRKVSVTFVNTAILSTVNMLNIIKLTRND